VYLVLVVAFLILGFFIVTYAAGYTIDFKNRQVSKTGLINLTVRTPDTMVYLNKKFVGNGNMVLRSLEPGDFTVEIKKDGFHDWSKTINLHEQEAVSLSNIVLFLKDPIIEQYDPKLTEKTLSDMANFDAITVSGGEIFQNNYFLTRLSTDVYGASWYPDRKQIIFSSDGFLRVIDLDGSNMVELFKKDSRSYVTFASSGKYVIFENNGQTFRAQIR